MKLSEFVWWPKEWTKDDIFKGHNTVPAEQIRQAGFLTACKLTGHGLLMEVDHYGETAVGRIDEPNMHAPGNMVGLRDFLLERIGDSIATIEDLDVEPDQFNVTR